MLLIAFRILNNRLFYFFHSLSSIPMNNFFLSMVGHSLSEFVSLYFSFISSIFIVFRQFEHIVLVHYREVKEVSFFEVK